MQTTALIALGPVAEIAELTYDDRGRHIQPPCRKRSFGAMWIEWLEALGTRHPPLTNPHPH
jgi:hypothetical protein